MSATQNTAKRWTCDGCGVSVRQMNGEHTSLPSTWASSTEGKFCLRCRRERAGSAALDSAPTGATRDARVRLHRAALLEFEVSRVPDRSNGVIAKSCRSSVPAVAEARRRLHLPDPPKPSPGTRISSGGA
ncbi:MAG: hypothetical protein ACRDNS_33485 [Trebonia sp.]